MTAAASARLIAHLDMDAFYASVELLRYPELRGRPVVIGGGQRHAPAASVDSRTGLAVRRFATLRDYAGRGVATTATYEARALGVHSAMGLMKAAALAPDAVLLPADFDEYRRHSRLFKAAVRTLAPTVEDRGIDEIYIDFTEVVGERALAGTDDARWEAAATLAQALKRAVHAATGLTCSIAVARNKLLAKIASDLDKPDGLTLLRDADLAARIWPLPPRRINGIGPKAGGRLAELRIDTIGALAAADPGLLVERFGQHYGRWLHDAAHGRDDRPVVTASEPRSISRETTFERDLSVTRDRAALSRIFTDLCTGVAGDLARKGYAARTIGIKLRYDDFRTLTRDRTLPVATQDAQAIRRTAGECLRRAPLDRRLRLLGVRASGLVAEAEIAVPAPAVEEPSLF
jgi:DNA polymerase-4